MKNLILKGLILSGVIIFAGTACDPDPVVENPPTLDLIDEAGFVSTSATLEAGATFDVKVSAAADESPLNVFRVYEDGSLIDASRILIEGVPAAANPVLLFDTEKNTITWEVTITAHDDASLRVYEFEVTAENDKSASESVDITTTLGTAVTTLTGVLLNQGGPAGTGGLDLDDGIGTGSSDPLAEIKDEGIDIGLPDASNWRQQLSGANGSTIKKLTPGENGLSESFTFADVSYKEDIAEMFTNNGVDFTQINSDSELISDVVAEGNLFVVENGSNYYMLSVVTITNTTDDNNDSYTFDIKK